MMGSVKKYYWLKLKRDFFKRHDIRIIEDMENGPQYILFYLKLLVESISHEGELRFSDTIPYNDRMLASVTHTNIDIVRAATQLFTELGMMEKYDDGTIYMQEIQKMVGAETTWAQKKRFQRLKTEEIEEKRGQEEDNVPGMSTECPPEKKTLSDKSKSKSKSKSNINTGEESAEPEPATQSLPATVQSDNNSKEIAPLKNELAQQWQEMITRVQPHTTWSNYGKERSQLNQLAKRTEALYQETPYGSETELATAVFGKFLEMRQEGRDKRIKGTPVIPSRVMQFWPEIVTAMADDYREEEQAQIYQGEEIIF